MEQININSQNIKHNYILSIDIGIHHLGLSLTKTDNDYNIQKILWIDLINITEFNCIDGENCRFKHEKTFADWISHIVYNNYDIFEQATHILIERQPPVGLTVVEQLLFLILRDKAILISPNSVHKFFNMGHKDYEERKITSEKIGLSYINKYSKLTKKFNSYNRKHDISDSILFTCFWCAKQRKKREEERLRMEREERIRQIKIKQENGISLSLDEHFEQFKYVPQQSQNDI